MTVQDAHKDSDDKIFLYLVLATALFTFMLIVIGIVLRVTDTASGCPNWPTCYGEWGAGVRTGAIIPYLHRVVALISGLLLALSTAWSVWRYRQHTWISLPLVGALLVMLLQFTLGGLIVLQDFSRYLSVVHLGLALIAEALVLVSVVAIFQSNEHRTRLVYRSPFARLSLLTLGMTFAVLVSGAFVAASGATAACSRLELAFLQPDPYSS